MSPSRLSRRALLAAAAGSALAVPALLPQALLSPALARSNNSRPNARPMPRLSFPDGFRWGTATSSYQVEGAPAEEGRGPSIWDVFGRTPGRIKDGTTGENGVGHFHRYKEDVALMKGLGVRTYRFSIAWSRVFPDGGGKPNPQGLAFYDRLIDELLRAGIEPWATLYHWDLPQALQDRGGWQSRDTAQAFADYASHVGARLSDRVSRFFPLNEILTVVEHGHNFGVFAPGLKLPRRDLNQVRHHAVLAHGLGVQALRAATRKGTRIGPAENLTVAVPAIETPDNVRAAELATRELNAPYLTVMMEGRYSDDWLAQQGADAPAFTAQELKAIGSPVDFLGINVYTSGPYVVANESAAGFETIDPPPTHPHMDQTPWLKVAPETLYWAPRHVARLWKAKEIYVTENGTSGTDQPAAGGAINDVDRVMYLRNYLTHLQRATAEGVPVRGYFLWSLLDNFEWADGYATRFGLVHVDPKTQRRTPKLSAAFYREVIARNAVA